MHGTRMFALEDSCLAAAPHSSNQQSLQQVNYSMLGATVTHHVAQMCLLCPWETCLDPNVGFTNSMT